MLHTNLRGWQWRGVAAGRPRARRDSLAAPGGPGGGGGGHAGGNCINIGLPGKMILSKGASIYDVHTEGGGGVSPKEDVVREVA